MSLATITFRLVLAIIISGCIGAEREWKNRPAGVRTHVLVCLGAAIIALVQIQLGIDAINYAQANPDLVNLFRADSGRLTAQVISGIGFLGAGTIIISKRSILGLTTAATVWTTACLGITIGMGYYNIAVLGAIAIMVGLTLLKKIINMPTEKKIEVKYLHRLQTKEFLNQYFAEKKIIIKDVEFSVDIQGEKKIYDNVYTIETPEHVTFLDIIEEISIYKNVTHIKIVNI